MEDYGIVWAARHPRVPHDLHVQTSSVRKAVVAVLVVPLVRPGHEELVDEVALATHDLDPVVPRVVGQDGAAKEVLDRGPHARVGQLTGGEGRDEPAGDTGRDRKWVIGVAGVQDWEENPARLDPVRSGGGRTCGFA